MDRWLTIRKWNLKIHEVCHSSMIYLLIDGLKLENEILKEVGSNESDVFAC